MKKLFKSKMFKHFTILFIFIMMIEIIFRLISGINVFNPSLIRITFSSILLSTILSYVISFLSDKGSKIASIIIGFIITIYSFLQLGFKNFIGVYISVKTSSQLGAVIDYVREFVKSFLPSFYYILIPFALLLIYFIFIDKYTIRKSNKRFQLKSCGPYGNIIKTISTILLITISSYIYYDSLTNSYYKNELQTVKTKDLFLNPTVPSTAVNQFGILGYGLLDVSTVNKKSSDDQIFIAANGEILESDRKIDDTVWKEVNDKETNPVYKNINEYLMNRDVIGYNEYTGKFKGKNLIVIMMESVNEIFINEEYFPNFYKLYNEGLHFVNNYSPRNSCSTGNNEFSGITSLYTIQNNCTANIYRNNTYPKSLFNMFNNIGYTTTSMHNYTEQYYFRRTIHPNLGSNKYYGVEDLGIEYFKEYRNWSSDEDFMKVAMDITLKDTSKPFMLWLTTVSSHQPYVVPSVEGDKHIDLFKDKGYSLDLQRYLSKLKTLDNGLGVLLSRLKEEGILDDTVIALYGDHYPYGLKNNTLNEILEYDLGDYETERVPFTIYNSKVKPEKIEKYTSFINITPTLANLFGLEYDPRLYMGTDLFSDDYLNIVTFADGSWKNQDAFYDASDGSIKYYTDKKYTMDEIKKINTIVTNKMKISGMIIRDNYYEYLNNKIEEIKDERDNK